MITAMLPNQIHASIHQDAISRVPDFFNASAQDILNELFQNSRRAGATRIDVTYDHTVLTITDDGDGVSDPSALLAFGHSDWEPDLAQTEQPAGMGIYSLARQDKVTIRSKTATGPAWEVTLNTAHFTGQASAPIRTLPDSTPRGTSISFNIKQVPNSTFEEAARYHPLPIFLNSEKLEQQDFLHRHLAIETWRGLRIGIQFGHNSKINFHGVTAVCDQLPILSLISSNLSADIDVIDCPSLQLTLPARKEVVQTRFIGELHEACKFAIYRALRDQLDPLDVPYKVQQDALKYGISLPDARRLLKAWQPDTGNIMDSPYINELTAASDNALLIDTILEPPDQQTLARAAEQNGIMDRLMQADTRLAGYPWYDALTTVSDITVTISQNGRNHNLEHRRDQNDPFKDPRPDRITLELHGTSKLSKVPRLSLPTDVAFFNAEEDYMDMNQPLVTKDSNITPNTLADLMYQSFFDPSDNAEADSLDTQAQDHIDASYVIALRMLDSPEEAMLAAITEAFRRHVAHRVPFDYNAEITVGRHPEHHTRTVSVTLTKAQNPDHQHS